MAKKGQPYRTGDGRWRPSRQADDDHWRKIKTNVRTEDFTSADVPRVARRDGPADISPEAWSLIELVAARFAATLPDERFKRGARTRATDAQCVTAALVAASAGVGRTGLARLAGLDVHHTKWIIARGKRLVAEAARRGDLNDLRPAT